MIASSESPGPTVTATRTDRVGVLELSRPDKFNALERKAFEAIEAAMDEFERPESGVRAVLVRAQGKNFCTGGDLAEAKSMLGNNTALADFLRLIHSSLNRLENSSLPVVAACQGLVLAGGLELALCCDVVLASSDARFGDQHVQYGLVPAWGATQRLPRAIGPGRAADMMFSGRWIDAATAERWGLVSQVLPPGELSGEALRYCHKLATRSRPGLAAMKRLYRTAGQQPLNAGLRLERAAVVESMSGPDPAEGITAFEQRRDPEFRT